MTDRMAECGVYGGGRVICPFEWARVDVLAGDERVARDQQVDYRGGFYVSDEYAGETVEVWVREAHDERTGGDA